MKRTQATATEGDRDGTQENIQGGSVETSAVLSLSWRSAGSRGGEDLLERLEQEDACNGIADPAGSE